MIEFRWNVLLFDCVYTCSTIHYKLRCWVATLIKYVSISIVDLSLFCKFEGRFDLQTNIYCIFRELILEHLSLIVLGFNFYFVYVLLILNIPTMKWMKCCCLIIPSKIKTKYSCFKGNPWIDILYTCFCQYVIFAALVTSLKCIRELSYVDTAALRSTKYTWCEDEERKRLHSSTRGWKSEGKYIKILINDQKWAIDGIWDKY